MKSPLLEVENLSIQFKTENGVVEAVKKVGFSIPHGGSLAIVGVLVAKVVVVSAPN
jgi:ABC-type dipeptide/oligopeptide/nickel transport system ATPase component